MESAEAHTKFVYLKLIDDLGECNRNGFDDSYVADG